MNQWKRSIYIRETSRANCASQQVLKLKHTRKMKGQTGTNPTGKQHSTELSHRLPKSQLYHYNRLGSSTNNFSCLLITSSPHLLAFSSYRLIYYRSSWTMVGLPGVPCLLLSLILWEKQERSQGIALSTSQHSACAGPK